MICHICGKSEMAMRAAHKECIDDLWRRIAERNEEIERLRKEVQRLEKELGGKEVEGK